MQAALKFSRKEEATKFILEHSIKILNLCHIPEDGRLKTLSFPVTNERRVHEILHSGERVDGSNLFSSVEVEKSDVHIVPRLDKSFVNPFSKTPTLTFLCEYLDEGGRPLSVAPQSVLARAEENLRSSTGLILRALAELEFFVVAKKEGAIVFPEDPDKNYNESAPFAKFEDLRSEILVTLESIGIETKYGHSEVGSLLTRKNVLVEQHEVELMPQKLARMADEIPIAKWVVRNVCAKHSVSVSFSPKIALRHAGTGMHIHLSASKNGENVLANSDGTLSVEAMKMIGGVLKFAQSLSAFGNPTPVSYLRFLDRKESPMHVCWSDRNRLALIRIPLWWNLTESDEETSIRSATFEYRAPDAFANSHLLFAGLAMAVNYGIRNSEETLRIAEEAHLKTGGKKRRLKILPLSCDEAAEKLRKDRRFYQEDGVFPKKIVNKTIAKLRSYRDKNLWQRLAEKPEKAETVLKQYLHYG